MTEALIQKIIDSSVVDGPGNRSAIFFQGCNFNCTYCHNPETIPMKSPTATSMTLKEVLAVIQSNIPFIQGITTSGGECTLQKEFLRALFRETKKLGLTNFMDTNGSVPFTAMEELLALTDGVMLDVKAADNSEHIKLTGASNETVLQNLDFLASRGKLYEIRTVLVENAFDNLGTIRQVSEILKPYFGTGKIRYKLIRVRSKGVRTPYRKLRPPSEEMIVNLRDILLKAGFSEVVVV
ncbi:MAG: hypothetical protein AVO33_01145 [delta proteobacterium ML8_F1]|nr:MAG: hypothetical protein AVO33_01145 [delta proteobacterium ML8_F1]